MQHITLPTQTAKMAVAVGQSRARRILIPVNHCDNYVVGVSDLAMSHLIEKVVEETGRMIAGECRMC